MFWGEQCSGGSSVLGGAVFWGEQDSEREQGSEGSRVLRGVGFWSDRVLRG